YVARALPSNRPVAEADGAVAARMGAGGDDLQRGGHRDRRGGAALLVRARLPGLARLHEVKRGGGRQLGPDTAQLVDRVRQPAAELPAGGDRGADLYRL